MDQQPVENEHPRHFRRRSRGLWWGFLLVALGGIFLLQNLGILGEGVNWWAIFILAPALTSLTAAWYAFEHSGFKFNAAVRGGLGGGLILLTVGCMFLFGADWSTWWPLMVIVPGFTIFLNGLSRANWHSPALGSLVNMNLWIGIDVMLLGGVFLANNVGIFSIREAFGNTQWWGIFILIPGVGLIFNALMIFLKSGKFFGVATQVVLYLGLAVSAIGALALLGLQWNMVFPVLLIVAGFAFLSTLLFRRS